MASASPYVVEADDETFETLAIEGSHERPVVVDFWAEWCGPCRTLGPLLESLSAEFAGAFTLVKVDTEHAPKTAQQWNIRSIPAVAGLRDGEVVDQFVGAQSEEAVRQFLSRLIPSTADRQCKAATDFADAGRVEEAEHAFREALELEAGHPVASIGLGHLLLTRGDLEAASQIAAAARRGTALDGEVERLETAIRIRSGGGEELARLESQIAEVPNDPARHIAFGQALAAAERYEECLEAYLAALRLDPRHDDEAGRRAILEVFEVLGSDHDLTRRYRAQLARLLYR